MKSLEFHISPNFTNPLRKTISQIYPKITQKFTKNPQYGIVLNMNKAHVK